MLQKDYVDKYTIESDVKNSKIVVKMRKEKSSNDSQGILLVKLSPVTTYVCLENEIPLLSTDSQRKSISEMQQYLLKEFRDKLEKITCLYD